MTQPFGQETPADVRAERDALRAEVERLRALLSDALPELDEHDNEYKHITKAGLKEAIREALGDD